MKSATFFVALTCLLVVVSFAAAFDMSNEGWEAFKQRNNKKYDNPTEDYLRRAIREMNLKTIEKHNIQRNNGYELGENSLIDLTPAEYRKLLGYRSRPKQATGMPSMPIYSNTVDVGTLPSEVNWTAAGWVGPVMHQGGCSSCWAYSSTGAIEAQYMNVTGTWVKMSEQNLIDCSSATGNLGCHGGDMDLAFWYVQTNGLESLASYPDVSNGTGLSYKCAFNANDSVTSVISWRDVQRGSELALQQAVALAGPVSVGVDASPTFQFYRSGIYAGSDCSSTLLNHSVLVVGYGGTGDQSYWLIKNSWGTSWGMDGYMMMARNDNNMCGIATMASFPVIG